MEIFHNIDVMLSILMGLGGRQVAISFLCFCEFESSLVREFEIFGEIPDFGVLQSVLGEQLQAGHQMVRKILLYIEVLHIHYYKYYYNY